MFNYQHYVPILKGKAGEFKALSSLSSKTKDSLTPLINVPRLTTSLAKKPKKTLEAHLNKIAKKIGQTWGKDRPLFIDLFDIDLSARVGDGVHLVNYIFGLLRYDSVHAIPTTGLDRDSHYNEAVAEVISKDRRGVCIRLLSDDMDTLSELDEELSGLLRVLKIPLKEAHLLLDFRVVQLEEVNAAVRKTINLINRLPNISKWQTLTLAASGYPQDLSDMKRHSVFKIIRTEFALWRLVIAASKQLQRIPSFGDYGIVHPSPPELDPRTMNASAKIRYTLDEDWLILKGASLKKHPKKFDQYHDLSKNLMEMPEFMGAPFSEGDEYIEKCASFSVGSGSLTTWVWVDMTHHLTFVSQQIANSCAT